MGHTHEPGHTTTTVVEERDGMSGVLIAVIAIVLILFLLWAIFFSGWVIDRTPEADVDQTNIEQREETEVNVPSQDQPTTEPTGTAPSPAGSP
jgi:cytoskeletal protein RodZ